MQGGGRTVGRLFVHMYPVWLYEESLVTISIEFTVILYVRIRVSEDPYFLTPPPRTHRDTDTARRSVGVRKSGSSEIMILTYKMLTVNSIDTVVTELSSCS